MRLASDVDTDRLARRATRQGWIIAAVAFGVLLAGAGVRATPGVLITPLERDFGWSDASISAAVGINILLYGLIGPFAVALMERFGLRRCIGGALAVLAVGVGLTALMNRLWQLFVLWGVVVGAGSGVVALVFGATVAERWFERHRGLVMGLLTASSATGQLVFLPAIAWLAAHQGWRTVSLAMAAVAALAIVPVTLFLRDHPSELGLPPVGGRQVMRRVRPTVDPVRRALGALRRGLGTRDFWLLGGTFFICGFSTNGLIGTHLIPACGDHGIPAVRAAGLLALMGVFDLFGTTGSGWLTDRADPRVLLATYYGLRGLSLMFLPFALQVGDAALPWFAVFYGLDWIATVPPTVRLAREAFGRENASVMFGWIAATHQVGAAAATWSAGLIRTETGSYLDAFLSAGAVCLAAAVMALAIGRGRVAPAGRAPVVPA